MSTPNATSTRRAFLNPGGFSLHEGAVVAERTRVLRLTGVFARDLLRGWLARLFAAGFLLPAVGFMIYVAVRARVDQFAVPQAEQTTFLLTNLTWLFKIELGALLLAAAARVSPLIVRDAFHGALVLYFSRPVLRNHYLLARLLAAAGLGTVLLAVPALLVILAHLLTFGLRPGGALSPALAPLLWPLLALAVVLASALAATAVALVALACGVVVRSPSTAPLLLGGGVLGSLVVSWVLQAAWGRESAARSLDLHHGLNAFAQLLMMPLSPEAVPRFAISQALLGIAVWAVLAGGAWALLQRFLANPPLGRGRN